MRSRPSACDLSDFLHGELRSRAKRREIVRHLLTGCSSCSALLEELNDKGEVPPFLRSRTATKQQPSPQCLSRLDYSAAFAMVAQTLRFFVAAGRPVMEPPKAILAELGRLYEEIEPELAALTPERSAIPFLVLWLIQKSHACRYTAPGEMFEWALMSRLAAESCPPAIAGSPAKLADLRANAEAQLANALRVLGRSDEAGTVMALAWKNLQQGTGDYELRASLLRKEASRLIRLKSFETAFESLREAEGLLRGLELRQELIETETLEAAACHESGDFEYAAYLLEQALLAASQAKDIHLALALSNNLGHAYVKLGRQRHAVAAISAARDAAGDRNLHDSRYLRLHWNEGKLLVILGMLEPAERAFSRARSGFLTCGLLHEMILVTQDLVRVQRELGKLDAAERSVLATCTESHHWANGPEIVQELQRLQSLI